MCTDCVAVLSLWQAVHEDVGVMPAGFTYSIDPATNGASNDLFAINGTTGAITLDQLVPDFEDTPSYVITVIAEDSRGLNTTASVNITVVDMTESPSMLDTGFSVNENKGSGTLIGTMTVRDFGRGCAVPTAMMCMTHACMCEYVSEYVY